VDWVWVVPFTKPFARTRADVFVRRVLIGRLHAAALIVGETFAFGRGRRGNMRLLRRVGPVAGVRIVSVPEVRSGGAPISSSRIRRLIAGGRLARARRLLGRAPELYGTVVAGSGRGRRLGFPTANIGLRASTIPPRGVYAVRLRIGGRPPIPGVMNLGVRPTFGPGPLVCEVHLLGFSGRLTGRSVSVSLLARLRGERCFPSPRALVRQVERDIRRARQLFTHPQ
jgi:riboflavin kinase/FMN adenylyltransferase